VKVKTSLQLRILKLNSSRRDLLLEMILFGQIDPKVTLKRCPANKSEIVSPMQMCQPRLLY
jgi:hypothetical protein